MKYSANENPHLVRERAFQERFDWAFLKKEHLLTISITIFFKIYNWGNICRVSMKGMASWAIMQEI